MGCDMVVNSGRAADACGECGGNNLCKFQAIDVMLGESIERRMSRSQTNLILNAEAESVADEGLPARTSAAHYGAAVRDAAHDDANSSEHRTGEAVSSAGDPAEEDVLMRSLWEADSEADRAAAGKGRLERSDVTGGVGGGREGGGRTLLSRGESFEKRDGNVRMGGARGGAGRGEEENLVGLALLSGAIVCLSGMAFALLVWVGRR
jgi:hypothetical protein